jgi:hypothetical protein
VLVLTGAVEDRGVRLTERISGREPTRVTYLRCDLSRDGGTGRRSGLKRVRASQTKSGLGPFFPFISIDIPQTGQLSSRLETYGFVSKCLGLWVTERYTLGNYFKAARSARERSENVSAPLRHLFVLWGRTPMYRFLLEDVIQTGSMSLAREAVMHGHSL